jgi:hypothetical protein
MYDIPKPEVDICHKLTNETGKAYEEYHLLGYDAV